jgi:two-component system NtrC family response regulator
MVQTDATSRFTVLFPDERDGWSDSVGRLLEPQGVQTIVARSGRQALELIRTTPIHCAVLDVRMPQLGGLQVIKLMRELPAPPPAILLTQHQTGHLLREALGMQVFSVLLKPVDFNLLLDTLARVIRRFYENRWPVATAPLRGPTSTLSN